MSHSAIVAQDEDVDGVQDCTRIGAVRLLDIHKYNQGITWGVDDLDRRRNFVTERCVIAGKSFGCAQAPQLFPPALR
jgi:hypothetical protein